MFPSISDEQIFQLEHIVNIDFDNLHMLPCVFRVPKSLAETKPEAYAPQKLGLGPYHHRRPDLYAMQWKKLLVATKFLIEAASRQDFDQMELNRDAEHMDMELHRYAEQMDIEQMEQLQEVEQHQHIEEQHQDVEQIENIEQMEQHQDDEQIENIKQMEQHQDVEQMEQHQEQIEDIEHMEQHQNIKQMEEHLKSWEPLIRASYDEYLDLDPSMLARIVAIDTLYLLYFFQDTYDPYTKKKFATDILMLENQIPGNFLVQFRRILNRWDDDVFSANVLSFCREVSPLELSTRQIDILALIKDGHILNVMYNLILLKSERERETESDEDEFQGMMVWHAGPMDWVKMAGIATAIGIPGARIIKEELSIMEKVPWEFILDKLKKADPDLKENSLVEEIRIPSVSRLTNVAGIRFEFTPGGIRDVRFDEREKKFYLPVITLHSNSEVVLRNLLAYEAASAKPGSALELAEYVDLMCGIIDTTKDVEILRKAKIIVSHLKPEKITGIFNGVRRTTGDKGEDEDEEEDEREIGKAIKKVNELYGNTMRVKAARFIKKYCYMSWKFIAVVSSLMLLALLALQAFCVIYDCKKHWSTKINPLQVFESLY